MRARRHNVTPTSLKNAKYVCFKVARSTKVANASPWRHRKRRVQSQRRHSYRKSGPCETRRKRRLQEERRKTPATPPSGKGKRLMVSSGGGFFLSPRLERMHREQLPPAQKGGLPSQLALARDIRVAPRSLDRRRPLGYYHQTTMKALRFGHRVMASLMPHCSEGSGPV